MYQAIPYSSARPWLMPPAAEEAAVVAVKPEPAGLGVNPAVHEVADESALAGVVPAGAAAEAVALPAVFVGGKLLGGLDRLMAVHISGELVPILKKAGALWL
ncbi:unnamed protein product [Miscanthus lutarioriparius]|uniref:Uncharacterized protein n=1 Tax=Miscanthus lutarioriparius TaxID=422564 RepID=A0A811NYT0_9POAL|nr:unnamed protein product [Miscanthus lutarioriparius]